MASCIRCSTQWMWSLFTTKSLVVIRIFMTNQLTLNASPINVNPGSPAQILNLHPLLSDDGGHVGVHGDRHPGLSPLQGLASPLRILPLHRVEPLHREMPEYRLQIVLTTHCMIRSEMRCDLGCKCAGESQLRDLCQIRRWSAASNEESTC